MPVSVNLKDLTQFIPLRIVCRIWDSTLAPRIEFLADVKLYLDLGDCNTAEECVDALYKQFSQDKLEKFQKILNFHLSQ